MLKALLIGFKPALNYINKLEIYSKRLKCPEPTFLALSLLSHTPFYRRILLPLDLILIL